MKKILIIEDEKMLGEMYRDKFTQAGFDVVWVDSAVKKIVSGLVFKENNVRKNQS